MNDDLGRTDVRMMTILSAEKKKKSTDDNVEPAEGHSNSVFP